MSSRGGEGTLVVGEGAHVARARLGGGDAGEEDGVVPDGDVFVELGGLVGRRAR